MASDEKPRTSAVLKGFKKKSSSIRVSVGSGGSRGGSGARGRTGKSAEPERPSITPGAAEEDAERTSLGSSDLMKALVPENELSSLEQDRSLISKSLELKITTASPTRGKKKLSIMPLAVLLPAQADVRALASYQNSLLRRLRILSQANQNAGDEVSKEALSEESMLNQVVQWLRVDRTE